MLNLIKERFESAKFKFNENGIFRLSFKDDIPPFLEELKFLDNKKWIQESVNTVSIGENNDYSLMMIEIIKKNDKIYFSLRETPLLIEVEKKCLKSIKNHLLIPHN
ncbi:hypothetical protein [Aestuariibaculum suncheonense]|uniref:Uncharacterized protein n=1 Tax=Aestuariibaculum suncheonense TaxID=1028745 RepID=A0A8J6UAT6_9FLAO|nr:hypothetical protein [Aestuariibaculum suncheonense]MBD0835230.1 hypothetical protein [Aestuariibaculum suncheonense]